MKRTQFSKSARETRRIAEEFALKLSIKETRATVVGLIGELGVGKTLFVQRAAWVLGVRGRMLSPTFLIARAYPLPRRSSFKKLYHLDAYRIKNKRDLDNIHFFRILESSRAVVFIEWADRIRRYLPKDAYIIRMKHGKSSQERNIKLSSMK
jgi:tRNA threonylcarbamoyladenosine biosynthesis protein TsaE